MKLGMFVSVAAVAAVAGLAVAGPLSTTSTQNIFGASYGVQTFNVRSDLAPTGGPDLQPEGMVFYNNTLYVSGDSTAAESNGYMASYAGGVLNGSVGTIGQFSLNDAGTTRLIGSEGIAVNTRGSGYGSFSNPAQPTFLAVDNVGGTLGRPLLALNSGPSISANVIQGPVAGVPNSFLNGDDISFVPGAAAAQDRIAVLLDTGAGPSGGGSNGGTPPANNRNAIVYFSADSANPLVTGTTYNELSRFQLPDNTGAKGLLFLAAADAALLFPSVVPQDALLISANPSGTLNNLFLYSLDGTLLASSALTGFTAVEALAYDPATQRLFLGDEGGRSISVLTVPAPASALMLGMGAMVARRRRR